MILGAHAGLMAWPILSTRATILPTNFPSMMKNIPVAVYATKKCRYRLDSGRIAGGIGGANSNWRQTVV